MRTSLIAVAALAGSAHADPCAGEAASAVECSAIAKRGAMSVSAGWSAATFDPAGHTFDVKHVGYANTIGSFSGTGLAPLAGDGFFLDVRLHATPVFYAGVDLGAAWGAAPASWDSAMVMTMAAVAGARVPIGRLSLRGELVAGLHGATLTGMAGTLRADAAAALVEPRVALDVWLHRWWALEAFAGVNALDRTERCFGLGLGFHSQAFDGRN